MAYTYECLQSLSTNNSNDFHAQTAILKRIHTWVKCNCSALLIRLGTHTQALGKAAQYHRPRQYLLWTLFVLLLYTCLLLQLAAVVVASYCYYNCYCFLTYNIVTCCCYCCRYPQICVFVSAVLARMLATVQILNDIVCSCCSFTCCLTSCKYIHIFIWYTYVLLKATY